MAALPRPLSHHPLMAVAWFGAISLVVAWFGRPPAAADAAVTLPTVPPDAPLAATLARARAQGAGVVRCDVQRWIPGDARPLAAPATGVRVDGGELLAIVPVGPGGALVEDPGGARFVLTWPAVDTAGLTTCRPASPSVVAVSVALPSADGVLEGCPGARILGQSGMKARVELPAGPPCGLKWTTPFGRYTAVVIARSGRPNGTVALFNADLPPHLPTAPLSGIPAPVPPVDGESLIGAADPDMAL